MEYELEATVTKFIYYKKDKNGNAFVELRGTTIVDNEDKEGKTLEYNLLKAKEGASIEPVEVTEQYRFDETLMSVLSLLFANKSKATFIIKKRKSKKKSKKAKYKIIAVEIKP
ncbi:MAG: hypothetical protein LUG91_07050 [Ruminococcus sp.]|nr:hypothetical protein [Ruminococcus sp.]